MKHIVVIRPSEDNMGQCELCGAENQALRPYGPNGESICYNCGMKDESTTEKQFFKLIEGADVVISESGERYERRCER